jgi:hypothetical protein
MRSALALVRKLMDKKATKSRRTKKVRSSDSPANEPHSPEPSTLSGEVIGRRIPRQPARGTGPASAGQSGDLQGLPRDPDADSQSVEELVEEGQFFEAEVVAGVEDALEPELGEVRTHEVPEDDGLI